MPAVIGVKNEAIATLPDGYAQFASVKTSGEVYFDTGVLANQNTRLKMKFKYFSGDVVFGAYNQGGGAGFGLQAVSGKWYTYYGSSNGSSGVGVEVGADLEIDMNKNVTTLNGKTIRTAGANTFNGNYPLYLAALNNMGKGASNRAVIEFDYCQIYDEDVLVRDYVVVRSPDGTFGIFDQVNEVFCATSGGGGIEVGTEIFDSMAREVVDIEVSINKTARMVRVGSIGVGGVARPFFGDNGLIYYGKITPLSVARAKLMAGVVGEYALFVGGRSGSTETDLSGAVDAYDKSMCRVQALELVSGGLVDHAVAQTESHLLVCGGTTISADGGTMLSSFVEAYDGSLTKTRAEDLPECTAKAGGARAGDCALFFGGKEYHEYSDGKVVVSTNGYVYAYDDALTLFGKGIIPFHGYDYASGNVGEIALFCGGYDGNGYGSDVLYYCDESLSMGYEFLSTVMIDCAVATLSGHALVAGGGGTVVNAFDASLTRTIPSAMSKERNAPAASSTDGFAVFVYGDSEGADVYDESLTRSILDASDTKKENLAAVGLGNLIMFGGGEENGLTSGDLEAFLRI